MLGSSNVSGFRKRVAGISLLGSAAALVAQDIVAPHAKEDAASMYDAFATHPDTTVASSVILLVSAILLIPAVFGIVHLVRGRGVPLAHVGAALGVLGALGHTAITTATLIFLETPRVGDRTAMIALLEHVNNSAAINLVIFPLIVSFGFGMLLLSLALWRARVVRAWVPALVIGAVALHFGAPEDMVAASVAASVLGGIAFGYVGLRVLRMSDAAWEHELPGRASTQRVSTGKAFQQQSDVN